MLTSAQLLAMTREQAIAIAAKQQRLLAAYEAEFLKFEGSQVEAAAAKQVDHEVTSTLGLARGSTDV